MSLQFKKEVPGWSALRLGFLGNLRFKIAVSDNVKRTNSQTAALKI